MSAKAFRLIVALGLMMPSLSMAFNSGSTGVDGDFKPTANVKLQLPPDGVFNFKSINIPANVTVTFARNAANTPVYVLVQNDATIAGTIDVSGQNSTDTGTAGDGNMNDDGIPGQGGPGGFDGGAGGYAANPPNGFSTKGGDALGPGGGKGGDFCGNYSSVGLGGSGAGFGLDGVNPTYTCITLTGGKSYGNAQLQPLIGGSGGGGSGGTAYYVRGLGGGGGGGAILLAASGTVNITGKIQSNGGNSGANGPIPNVQSSSYGGGGGSGGAIRIMASILKYSGQINATAGSGWVYGGSGSVGRIRLEAESPFINAGTNPVSQISTTPGLVFLPNQPTLSIASVAGVAIANNTEISIPAATANPVNVVINAKGIPPGTLASLTAKPENAASTNATPAALVGTAENSSATLQVDLPVGASILEASTTFVITAALGNQLAPYAGNERVEKITLVATTGGQSETRLITVSGKTYPAPKGVWGVGG